jgi:hypothetical protein
MPGGAGFRAHGLVQSGNQAQNGGSGNNIANPLQQQFPGGQPQQHVAQNQQMPSTNIRRPGSGGYDGPGEPSRSNPYGPGLGFDPAKPVVKERVITNTRVELPAAAYSLEGPSVRYPFSFQC